MAKVSAASGAKYSHEQSDLTHVKKHLDDEKVTLYLRLPRLILDGGLDH